ncbi:uncharacterized protein N7479_007957 [Penicillium vulpinum]|uniref:uncharacterized protein n=1 Tax=Penicillium vulpinum TaxID=29845 RepID=UPI00254938EA|nr:uncharacterized protein N7479_007957 [Penicillium vulpinum]KAJ5960807.1 hypothetical protein N7479_007957 [Penicillium vulpinum]
MANISHESYFVYNRRRAWSSETKRIQYMAYGWHPHCDNSTIDLSLEYAGYHGRSDPNEL